MSHNQTLARHEVESCHRLWLVDVGNSGVLRRQFMYRGIPKYGFSTVIFIIPGLSSAQGHPCMGGHLRLDIPQRHCQRGPPAGVLESVNGCPLSRHLSCPVVPAVVRRQVLREICIDSFTIDTARVLTTLVTQSITRSIGRVLLNTQASLSGLDAAMLQTELYLVQL